MTVKFGNPAPRSLYVVCAILVTVTFALIQVVSLNAALTCSVLLSSALAALIVSGSDPHWVSGPKAPSPDLTRADMIRLSVDCNMPWIDYDNGEIWTVERCREWLALEDKRAELETEIAELKARARDLPLMPLASVHWVYDALDAAEQRLRDLEEQP